ncbi:hypothetical protein DRP05_08490 [Archaeoglobales archaeon]|nr:MAG: hypothetical protein DRP05_08490 [Archaeoglobales archaeon]
MYVIVSDPDGKTIGKKFIPKENLFDGLEIVRFQMAPPKTTPKSRNYTVVLEAYPSREMICSKKPTFKGPDIIVNVYYDTKNIVGKEMYHPITLHYKNIGDLPLLYTNFHIKISADSKTIFEESVGTSSKVILQPSAGGPYGSYGHQIPYNTKNFQNRHYYLSIIISYRISGEVGERAIIYGFDLLKTEQGISTTLVEHYNI